MAQEDGHTPAEYKRARPVTDRARHVRVADGGVQRVRWVLQRWLFDMLTVKKLTVKTLAVMTTASN
jgi:hypothetical protein